MLLHSGTTAAKCVLINLAGGKAQAKCVLTPTCDVEMAKLVRQAVEGVPRSRTAMQAMGGR